MRLKKNIKLTEDIIRGLKDYANTVATMELLKENDDLKNYFELGEYIESMYSLADSIAYKICELCKIEGEVDRDVSEFMLNLTKKSCDENKV